MKSMDGRQGSSSSFRTPQRRTSSIPGNSTPQREDSGPRQPGERAGENQSDKWQRDGRNPSSLSGNQIGIKQVYEQQVKLTSKIEEVLEGLHTPESRKKCGIPRELSAIVHDCYQKLSEDDDQEKKWDFTVRFDDPINRHVNRELVTNVLAVTEKSHDVTLIKRALRTYFKSKKTEDVKKRSGKSTAFAASARKRQRRHNKCKARLRVLRQSTTLDEAAKKKIEPVLQGKYMSSEESLIEDSSDDNDDHEHSSDSEREHSKTGKKRLIKHTLPWRSREFERIIESLDRKLDRRRSIKSKAMCLQVEIGEASSREKPDDLPEWACNMHHELFES